MTPSRARRDQERRIDTNPATVYWTVKAMIDDGYGSTIPDPSGAKTTYYVDDVMVAVMNMRVSGEKGSEPSFGYSQPLLLTAKYSADWLANSLVLYYNKRVYRVDDVQDVRYGGEVITKSKRGRPSSPGCGPGASAHSSGSAMRRASPSITATRRSEARRARRVAATSA